ncbi:peptidoglycan DD-metalloendopeptidase family protein [Thioclava sp. A2]|uniref:peptidoglycan DD-metalloendopeptidase family protein n=1 Tax=Thioclava sp. FCG-A2 TaxID=3080562 RepID=UPI002953613A|nr:peptidoglycan DD-metalloendopeptidase family protein [Thioclava sp. A2]MDV7269495.1 peptidoglycan DD-metalloendopeptidase family protein [Thioclava sp. A2]
MMNRTSVLRLLAASSALMGLAACDPDGTFDADLRNWGQIGFDTTDAARQASASRPSPDARGVISYPGYQVAVARSGDTVQSVAARVGVDAQTLASYNAVAPNATLNKDEVLALPVRVAEPATNAGAIQSGEVDITSLAGAAIDRAETSQPKASTTAPKPTPVQGKPSGPEPIRHKVARGETAYSIARYYNVPVRNLADWNGLPADLSVREGQFLLIPVANATPPKAAATAPGDGSTTPTPPSAAKPLPAEVPPKASAPVDKTAAPDLGKQVTASKSKLEMPVSGAVIRPYSKGKNDGVDLSATPGAAVHAAEAGTVAAITKDTENVPILVLRHADGLLTVYANIDAITVKKGDSVKRGQSIAKVRNSSPGFIHFEVRQGFESVDPMPYLQ